MANSSKWTVAPSTVRRELDVDGDTFWVDLKQELTAGEAHHLFAGGLAATGEGWDWQGVVFGKVQAYVVDWSLCDDAGAKLPVTLDTYRALRVPVFRAIEKAVDDHAKAVMLRQKKVETPETPTGTG